MRDAIDAPSHLNLSIFASGSRGNAAVVENVSTGQSLLIDCGLSKSEVFKCCKEYKVDTSKIEAILVTHEHSDHTKGLGVLTRGLARENCFPAVYVSDAVRKASAEITALGETCEMRPYCSGEEFSLAGITVLPFATSHDSVESFGFRFQQDGGNAIGYLTDSGVVTPEAFEALQDCRVLALESNHGELMLQRGTYPRAIRERVSSDQGHLSNEQAVEALEQLLSPQLEAVVAMHVSEKNNTYRLPREMFERTLQENDHPAQVCTSYQRRAVSLRMKDEGVTIVSL